MKMLRMMLLLAAGIFAQGAMAAAAPLKLGQVVTQQREIRTGVMAGTGRYEDMPETTRNELLARQERLLRMIDGKQDPSELTEVQRTEAFNTLEWIEATINNAEDERVTCTREQKTGTNRTTRVCRTQLQIREARDRAKRQMQEGSMPLDI